MIGSIRRLVFVMALSMLAVAAVPSIAVAAGGGPSSDVQALMATAQNEPPSGSSEGEAMPAVETPSVAPATSCEESLFPAEPVELFRPFPGCSVIHCDQLDSIYCDYSCSGEECCSAKILIQNSYCPRICI